MQFIPWKKGRITRLYVKGTGSPKDPYLDYKRGEVEVFNSPNNEVSESIMREFESLIDTRKPLSADDFLSVGSSRPNVIDGSKRFKGARSYSSSLKNIDHYAANSETIDVGACQFKSTSLRGMYVLVDNREPDEIYNLFCESKVGSVNWATLPIGDIVLGCSRTGAKVIIERKTVSDFSTSIKSSHAHDQAERLFDEQQREYDLGNDAKVVWMIEGSSSAGGLYSSLPEVKQTSGMVGYLVGVLDQHVVETYSKKHLVYLALKLLQTHVDKELINKVNSTNGNRDLAERKKVISTKVRSGGHGVNMGKRELAELLSVLPYINTKVATNLAESGLTFAQIANLTVDSLKTIDGIGDKTATSIHEMFNALN